MPVEHTATALLEDFARSYADEELGVRRAVAEPDIRQDGEAVTRVVLASIHRVIVRAVVAVVGGWLVGPGVAAETF